MPSFDWNVFRYLADLSHTLSKCILIYAIHANRSAEGVSLITQALYLLVFCARYLPYPIPHSYEFHDLWNTTLKVFYMLSSAYILVVMMRIFARTREREKAWKLGGLVLFGSLALAPFVMMIFKSKVDGMWNFREYCWIFSIILESVCVLPQLLLLRQTTVPTVIDSFYLVTLGSYRGFYILNWIVRGARKKPVDPVSIIFGCVETLIFIDFFWVYWTRQRVKLRGGVVVDSDDLRKSWLVKRLIGNKHLDQDGDEEQASLDPNGETNDPTGARHGWGPRGISVSADEGLLEDSHGTEGESGGLTAPEAFEDGPDEEAQPDREDGTASPLDDSEQWRENTGRAD